MAETKGLMTRDVLDKETVKFEGVKKQDVVLGKKVRFVGEEKKEGREFGLEWGDNRVTLLPSAFRSVVKHIGLAPVYADAVPVELLLPHLNFFYMKKRADEKIRLLVKDGEALAATMKINVDFVGLMQVVNLVEAELGKDNVVGYHKVQLSWEASMLSIVQENVLTVVPNDFINAGIRIEHSLVGLAPTKLGAYVYRQTCSNGATTMDAIGHWSRRNSADSMLAWVRIAIKEAGVSFVAEGKRLGRLRDTKIEEHVADVLNGILEEESVPRQLRDEVRTLAIDAKAKTLYDLYNVLTNVGTHSEFFEKHPATMLKLEKVAGNLTMNGKLCPECHRRLR